MNEQTLLEQLKDIHYPEALSWWPLAPGWYILFTILTLLVILIGICTFKFYKKLKKRREIINQFDRLKEKIKKDASSAKVWGELSSFLKRLSLLLYPRRDVGGLHGEAWLQFLNSTGRTTEFKEGIGSLLISLPYQPKPSAETEALLELVERWVRQQIKEKL
jgi:hypothetical protein